MHDDLKRWRLLCESLLAEMPKVWHGSPHSFDQFSLDHIGSGQGAQSYGWGLYFASQKDVAIWYRDLLTQSLLRAWPQWMHGDNSTVVRAEAEHVFHTEAELNAALLIWNALHVVSGQQSFEEVIQRTMQYKPELYGTDEATVRHVANTLYDPDAPEPKLYNVQIPNDSQFLQWDKVQQPPIVNQAFVRLFGRGYKTRLLPYENNPTGEKLYQVLAKARGSDKAASIALLKRGVHGVRYLDGRSRQSGRGSYNYVLFDAALAQIIKD